MNLIESEVTNGHLSAAGGLTIAAPAGIERGDRVIAGVRPESFTISEPAGESDGARGRVASREALGDETIYVVETEAGLLNVRMPATARFGEDQVVTVRHQGSAPPVYDPTTERLAGR
jgi:ABC-type sugar transport system ATPase subunit